LSKLPRPFLSVPLSLFFFLFLSFCLSFYFFSLRARTFFSLRLCFICIFKQNRLSRCLAFFFSFFSFLLSIFFIFAFIQYISMADWCRYVNIDECHEALEVPKWIISLNFLSVLTERANEFFSNISNDRRNKKKRCTSARKSFNFDADVSVIIYIYAQIRRWLTCLLLKKTNVNFSFLWKL